MTSDPTRKYCEPVEGRSNAIICKFCGYITSSGVISHVKNHLANMDTTQSVKMRDKVSHEVHEQMRELLNDNSQRKKQRESLAESLRADFEEIDEGPGESSRSSDPTRSYSIIKRLTKGVRRFFIQEQVKSHDHQFLNMKDIHE